ncbi:MULTISPECIES: glucosamine-6-phosphate deaminase [Aestuariimicrobium]|uniref:glucosamine-6-phosphate deaminase n=1 Tax=Aestuariimicrobium TaxID=396388 RepID=UPI0003B69703|nr:MULTISPECIES: glucosamine-6-phosphate deaminase [Aestuariimicrobium]CAI9401001.1 Glucosamine-6-phosphate deaminase [Aestuariimicrobium sp. T2.26MG-19.2B]
MEVIICADADVVARTATGRIVGALAKRPQPVLGLATGSSPLRIYDQLAALNRAGRIDLSGTRAFALDEYVGLPPSHPQSYAETIRTTVTVPCGMNPDLVHVPDGMATDIEAACQRYEDEIVAAGGIDVQILGIGSNGHIGFNEPTSSLQSRTRIKTLTARTRQDNERFFSHDVKVPTHCVTQGLGTIMDARRLVLVATGTKKADAIAAAVEGPVTSMCPASVMQFHRNAVVVVDEAAASKLTFDGYYRDIFEHLPEWQQVPGL